MPFGAAKAALLGAAGSGGAEGMEAIAKVVMDGTGVTVSFTSIPQTYRHLRIVMASGRRDSSGNLGMYLVFNSNTTVGDYGGWLQMNAGPSITRADHYWPPYGARLTVLGLCGMFLITLMLLSVTTRNGSSGQTKRIVDIEVSVPQIGIRHLQQR